MYMEIEALLSQINNDKMNSICFDCGAENPLFISINNGIFLCNQCATVHTSFPPGISTIECNDLSSLSEKELKFLAYGGNTRLNDFILDEYPKLENYSQKLLYKTRGMDYYRKRLNYYVNGGEEPKRPSQIVGCQLIPQNFYNQNNYVKKIPKRYEPKNRTYKPEGQRKFNISQRNNEDEENEGNDYFRDPYRGDRFGMNPGNDMFKRFFGNDLFSFDDDDFFGLGGNKLNQTQRFEPPPQYYQEKPKVTHNNIEEPQDNLSKSINPKATVKKINPRPLTSSHPIFVPSRKHKYIKKENQNNENLNKNKYSGDNVKYGPFLKKDSTDLITLPGSENNEPKRKKQKINEIPLEFHKQASGLGQITDAINENDDESDSSNELDRMAEQNEKISKNEKNYDESQDTFKDSIRNKYKKKKSEQVSENNKEQPKKSNINMNKKPSKKINTTNNDGNNYKFDKQYARKLSKMNITSTTWNINQLGDIYTYPDAMEIEA